MHDGMPYGRNQGQGQGHSREVERQSPTGLIFTTTAIIIFFRRKDEALLAGAYNRSNLSKAANAGRAQVIL